MQAVVDFHFLGFGDPVRCNPLRCTEVPAVGDRIEVQGYVFKVTDRRFVFGGELGFGRDSEKPVHEDRVIIWAFKIDEPSFPARSAGEQVDGRAVEGAHTPPVLPKS